MPVEYIKNCLHPAKLQSTEIETQWRNTQSGTFYTEAMTANTKWPGIFYILLDVLIKSTGPILLTMIHLILSMDTLSHPGEMWDEITYPR